MGRLGRSVARRSRPSDFGPVWAAVTRTLTKLARHYSVTASVRCFPGASGVAPGVCDTRTKEILIDGALLGSDEAQLKGELTDALREQLAVALGVTMHEIGHANHSSHEVLAEARRARHLEEVKLLEEPRMEKQLCDRHPEAVRLIHAAVRTINAPGLPKPGAPLSRAAAAHIGVVLEGRTHAGTLPVELHRPVAALVETGLGASDAERLRELLGRVVAISDGEIEPMIAAAAELREIIGADPEAEVGDRPGAEALGELLEALAEAEGRAAAEAGAGEPGEPDAGAGGGEAGREQEGIEAANAEQRAALEEAARTIEAVAREVADDARSTELREARRGSGGYGFGGHGSSRLTCKPGEPPGPAELRAAREFAKAIQRVRSRRIGRESSPVPGKFVAAKAMQAQAREELGAPGRPEMFRRRTELKAKLWAPEVGVAIDMSGSMGAYEEALAAVLWVASEGIRAIGGRFVAVGFGEEGQLICSSAGRLRKVPELVCGAGTERFDLAAPLLRERLRWSDRRRPRLCVIASDGIWTSAVTESEAQLAEINALGVATVAAHIGSEPGREHGAQRSVAVSDPREFGRMLGAECAGALERRPQRVRR